MTLSASKTVRDIVIENPATVRVFESLGIDYCCGGKRPLSDACASANVPLAQILESLAKVNQAPSGDQKQWNDAPLSDLAQHIVDKHHKYVRQEVDRLQPLLEKVGSKHAATHPELAEIKSLFAAIAQEMSTHMMKEEQVLFPYIQQMETAVQTQQTIPQAFFGSVGAPIQNMIADHEDAGELTSKIRLLSNDFKAPASACPSYLALYSGLEEFERDLHQHIHLENNLLFPKALEMERSHQNVGCQCS